ncbi:exported hypothetical protein [Candidatus Sulfopaludibacter sp. SbA3]|nr:exported hypothetical protein [Candidatus Sulfopaludibacter sp. SbA3]
MDSRVGGCAIVVLAAGLLLAANGQRGGGRGNQPGFDDPLPPGKISNADITRAKAEREQNIKDATRLAELA